MCLILHPFGINAFMCLSIHVLLLINSSSPDSMNTDRNDKNSSGLSTAMYKLIAPLLRCEVADIRDAAVNALGLINPDALKYVIFIMSNCI